MKRFLTEVSSLLDEFEILLELQMFNQSYRDTICQLPFWVLQIIKHGKKEVNVVANKLNKTNISSPQTYQKIHSYNLTLTMVVKKEIVFRVYHNTIVQATGQI